MRRRSGCPTYTMPTMSQASRSCQSAAGHTSVTVSTSGVPNGTSTLSCSHVLVFQEYTW